MVYAVNENMKYIKINNNDDLACYLDEYDVENQFKNKKIGVPIVHDNFFEFTGKIKELYELFFRTRHGKLPHFLVITESTVEKHFDVYDNISFSKTSFGELFYIVTDFRDVISKNILKGVLNNGNYYSKRIN